MNRDIGALITNVRAAQKALDDALTAAYPAGTKGTAILRSGQVTPTPVSVVCPAGVGFLMVKLENSTARCRRPNRTIPYVAFEAAAE